MTTTAPASSCAAAPTVTKIVTVRGNSTLLHGTSTGAPAAPATTAGPGKALVAKAQAQGTCPATIGWSKDYSHPVTLTETPRADRTVATGYAAATTTLEKPSTLTASASSGSGDDDVVELKQKVKSGAGTKCGAKKMRKRHSDNGVRMPWKKVKRT